MRDENFEMRKIPLALIVLAIAAGGSLSEAKAQCAAPRLNPEWVEWARAQEQVYNLLKIPVPIEIAEGLKFNFVQEHYCARPEFPSGPRERGGAVR
jgi:hypothetical protein